ncbi:MAG: chorismate mutase [Bacteroidia bacterium]
MDTLLNIRPLQEWLPGFIRPLIISGPCGAESEEQVMQTAMGLAALNKVNIFRAGVWKPRTRPNAFEGMGVKALPWLSRVKAETGMLTAVEVARAEHVEAALNHGIDILWIGARTTVNPFSVQEIAEALKGVDIPVMVKNPLHPDIQLWIGALERLNLAGINRLMAVHRGFYTSDKTQFRNIPRWELAIELQTLCPSLPMICDPSHICGRTDTLASVAQKALDLNMSGLMLEAHIHPEQALSDAKQQVTPEALGLLLNRLTIRQTESDNRIFTDRLQQFRIMIDEIDEQLVRTLAQRMDVVEQIGIYKRDNKVTVFQLERWLSILRSRVSSGISHGLEESFIKELYELLHKESIRKQTEISEVKKEQN